MCRAEVSGRCIGAGKLIYVILPSWLGRGQVSIIALAFWAIAIIAMLFNRAARREQTHTTFYGWISIICTLFAIVLQFMGPRI